MSSVFREKLDLKYIMIAIILTIVILILFSHKINKNPTAEVYQETQKNLENPTAEIYQETQKNLENPTTDETHQKTQRTGLFEVIKTENIMHNKKEIKLLSFDCDACEKLAKLVGTLSEKDKQTLMKYENIGVKVEVLYGLDTNILKTTIRTIVEEIKPVLLNIEIIGSLHEECIEGIRLNDNIEFFKLEGPFRNIGKELFGDWNINLTNIDISSNQLESFPAKQLKNIPNLKELDISNNENIFKNWKFSSDNGDTKFEKLTILKMKKVGLNNKIFNTTDPKKNIFSCLFPNIKCLDVSHNKLKNIFILPKKLEKLDITGNPNIFDHFNGCKPNESFQNLKELCLEYDRIINRSTNAVNTAIFSELFPKKGCHVNVITITEHEKKVKLEKLKKAGVLEATIVEYTIVEYEEKKAATW